MPVVRTIDLDVSHWRDTRREAPPWTDRTKHAPPNRSRRIGRSPRSMTTRRPAPTPPHAEPGAVVTAAPLMAGMSGGPPGTLGSTAAAAETTNVPETKDASEPKP